jgi:hypothetical protein
MRRDYFELEVRGVDWTADSADRDRDGDEAVDPETPTLHIEYRGPADDLERRLSDDDGPLSAGETDVAFRLLDEEASAAADVDVSGADDDAVGVLSVTNRFTGDFVLELNRPASDLLQFVDAARKYGQSADDEARYRIEIHTEDGPLATYEKSTFLVYDAEGRLLRSESLIPSGVEL